MPLDRSVIRNTGTSSTRGAGSSAITTVVTPITPGKRPTAGGPTSPPAGPSKPTPRWRRLLDQARTKLKVSTAATLEEQQKQVRRRVFIAAFISMAVVTFLVWLIFPSLGLPFRLPKTVGQLTPPGGWLMLEGGWSIAIGVAVVLAIMGVALRYVKNRVHGAVKALLITAAIIVVVQLLFWPNWSGSWLLLVGFVFFAVGVVLMSKDTGRSKWLSAGVPLIVLALVFVTLPVPGWLGWLPFWLILLLLAVWVMARFSWRIAQMKASKYAPGMTDKKSPSVVKPWLIGTGLAVLLVSLPISAGAGHIGDPSLSHPGAVSGAEPLKFCSDQQKDACANVLVDMNNESAGLLQIVEQLCLQDDNKDDPRCRQLATLKERHNNPERGRDPGENPGTVQQICELFKRMDEVKRCADLK